VSGGLIFAGMIVAFILHVLITYGGLFLVAVKQLPCGYIAKILPAVLTAMGTSSSAATLPVTLECAEKNGVPEFVAKFVLTLGATANMDGSAIYFSMSVLWLAATVGKYLNATELATVIFMSTLAAIGASPIPSSGLVLINLILNSINLSQPPLYSLIVALDPFLDRMVTMVNISGDSLIAKIVANMIGATAVTEVSVVMAGNDLRTEQSDLPMGVKASLRHDLELRGDRAGGMGPSLSTRARKLVLPEQSDLKVVPEGSVELAAKP